MTRFLLLATCALAADRGIILEDLTWQEAEKILTPQTIVVIPIGAESKEHGPHLKLKNDWLMAEYLKHRVAERADVVIAPTVNYHYYPAFVEYPGSTTLRLETARDLMIDICRSLARYGPKKFYALNTGVSTLNALRPSAEILGKEGILLRYTDLGTAMQPIEDDIKQEEGGTHADEIETSMMLYIAPQSVDMKKAVKDFHPGRGGLTRDPNGTKTYSPTGIWGDPTLATREKGKLLVDTLVTNIVKEIDQLKKERP
jgi:creatinine amidohydrolase